MLGTGTELDPYLVATAEDLNSVRNNLTAHYKQVDNINLCKYSNWIPIGDWDNKFVGSYDGGNFNIINLNINKPTESMLGLFGYAEGATILNCNISGNIIGNNDVGMLVGQARNNTTITKCSTKGSVEGVSYIGGFIAEIYACQVTNCSSDVDTKATNEWCGGFSSYIGASTITDCQSVNNVTGFATLGGFVGNIEQESLISQCYSLGKVTSDDGYRVGGFVGYFYEGTVTNCYARNDIYSLGEAGGFVGYLGDFAKVSNSYSASKITITPYEGESNIKGFACVVSEFSEHTNCFYDNTICPSTDGAAIGKSTAELKLQSTFTNWDFTTPIWIIDNFGLFNDGYPFLRNLDVLIYTPEQLDNIRNYLGLSYLQMNDLDLVGYVNWVPIGTEVTPFLGNYNGQGFNICNLTINDLIKEKVGLFSYIGVYDRLEKSILKNINLIDASITCLKKAGVLASYDKGSDFINCHSSGNIYAKESAGGLIYGTSDTNLIGCSSSVKIQCNYNSDGSAGLFGGLVYEAYGGNFKKCYATGDVDCAPYEDQYSYHISWKCGGLIGWARGTIDNPMIIDECYSTGKISCPNTAGGLIGYLQYAIVSNCYSTGDVLAPMGFNPVIHDYAEPSLICGFISEIRNVVIINSYSTGKVLGEHITVEDLYAIQGFVGETTNPVEINGCYYDLDKATKPDLFATPKTTAEMKQQATFINWDFTTPIWAIDGSTNDGYPFFYEVICGGLGVYVMTNEGIKQAVKMCIITDTGLKEISSLKVITDTGLK